MAFIFGWGSKKSNPAFGTTSKAAYREMGS